MNWYLGNIWYTLLLLILLPIGYLLWHYIRWKHRTQSVFADKKFHGKLFQHSQKYLRVFPILYIVAFSFLIFAMIDLVGGKQEIKVQQKMNNVLFLVDVSTSMNTQDVSPDRLSVAKNIIINTMQRMNNDRVGLVVFAGGATSVMPLTTDYIAAESFVAGLETSMMAHQGTDFLKGVEVALSKFKNISKGSGKIILLSDGEDNEGSEAEAIKLLKENNIQVTSVGIGTTQGAPIPEYIYGQLMGYKTDLLGETVISKKETKALKKIAQNTNGVYIDANDIDQSVEKILQSLERYKSETEGFVKSQSGVHYYQYFLAITLILFFIIYLTNPRQDFNI